MNLGVYLQRHAQQSPYKKAIVQPLIRNGKVSGYKHLTYKELWQKSNRLAYGFQHKGIKQGERVLVFIRPKLDFTCVIFALFKIGAVPVFIDPGMGFKNLLQCTKQTKAKYFIGEKSLCLLSRLLRPWFKDVTKVFSVSRENFLNFSGLNSLEHGDGSIDISLPLDEQSPAAILFTSGATGIPKGVIYQQKNFHAQIKLLKHTFNLQADDIDLAGFPLFGLFSITIGMTSLIAPMNPSKPAKAEGKLLAQVIEEQGVTFAAGSPAIWRNLAKYCISKQITLPSVKYLVMFGAPVKKNWHEDCKKILVDGDTYTPYGATEGLPVSCLSGSEVLKDFAQLTEQGRGICIGKPLEGVNVKIASDLGDSPEFKSEFTELDVGTVGEILVQGANITTEYFDREDETLKSKVYAIEGLWHRMGDLGYKDSAGNLWFCGRRSHRVQDNTGRIFHSVACEEIFNKELKIENTALISLKRQNKVEAALMIIKNGSINKQELKVIADSQEVTKGIDTFFAVEEFPVDVRHNIKINREKLSQLGEKLWDKGQYL